MKPKAYCRTTPQFCRSYVLSIKLGIIPQNLEITRINSNTVWYESLSNKLIFVVFVVRPCPRHYNHSERIKLYIYIYIYGTEHRDWSLIVNGSKQIQCIKWFGSFISGVMFIDRGLDCWAIELKVGYEFWSIASYNTHHSEWIYTSLKNKNSGIKRSQCVLCQAAKYAWTTDYNKWPDVKDVSTPWQYDNENGHYSK